MDHILRLILATVITVVLFLFISPVWLLSWVISPLKDVCAVFAFGIYGPIMERIFEGEHNE